MRKNIWYGQGRIGQDPEVKKVGNNNTSCCNFSIAINRWKKNKEDPDVTDWIKCTAWGHSADYIGQYVKKGDMLGVAGMLQHAEPWTDKHNVMHEDYVIQCQEVEILRYKANADDANEEPVKTSYRKEEIEPEISSDDLPF
ncbi:single-stranded DNA-binding protein [Pseudobutyrivibrio sp.]